MATIDEWKDLTLESIKTIGEKIGSTLPKITGGGISSPIGLVADQARAYSFKEIIGYPEGRPFRRKGQQLGDDGGKEITYQIFASLARICQMEHLPDAVHRGLGHYGMENNFQ